MKKLMTLLMATAIVCSTGVTANALSPIPMNTEPYPVLIREKITAVPVNESIKVIPNNNMKNQLELKVNGETVYSDVPITVQDNRVYLPVRALGECLGYDVSWNSTSHQVELQKGNRFIHFSLDDEHYVVNDQAVTLSSRPLYLNGRTLVPAEAVHGLFQEKIKISDEAIQVIDGVQNVVSGYVTDINETDYGYLMTVAPEQDSDRSQSTVLVVGENTILNADPIAVGDYVTALTSDISTRSLPPQTGAYVVYKTAPVTVETVGEIISFADGKVTVRTGDVLEDYTVSNEVLKHYYVGQTVQVIKKNGEFNLNPMERQDFSQKFTTMGEPILTIHGEVTAIDEDTFTVKTDDLTVEFPINDKIMLEKGQMVSVDYVQNIDALTVYNVFKDQNDLTLTVKNIRRDDDGRMVLETVNEKDVTYFVTIGEQTQINLNLNRIQVGDTVIANTPDVMLTIYPNQFTARRISQAK